LRQLSVTSKSCCVFLNKPLEPVQVWRLNNDEQERLDFVVRNERPNELATRIVEIAEAGSCPLVEPPKLKLSAAYARLEEEARQPSNETRIGYAKQQVAALRQEQLIAPLIDEAESAADPLEKNKMLALAQLLREVHSSQDDRLVNRYKNRTPAARESDHHDLQDSQTRINMILKLSKQTNSCKKLNDKDPFHFDMPRSRF
jgi:hypothetical protein